MMTNGDPEGQIFLSYPHTHDRFLYCQPLKLHLYPLDLHNATRMTKVYFISCHILESLKRSEYKQEPAQSQITDLHIAL